MTQNPALNIVVPMAGEGSRFVKAGYQQPKPFIPVNGRCMIELVLENLAFPGARFILVAQRAHLEAAPDATRALEEKYPITWVTVDGLTEGTACTILHARKAIEGSAPLLIANCDQIVDGGIQGFIDDAFERRLDGSILVFEDPHRDPKWSFAKTNAEGYVTEVAEKKAISSQATVGLYFFSQGQHFINSAIDMIARNERVNNEFYTCPTYNYAIRNRLSIGVYETPFCAMHGLGTPEDLALYLKHLEECSQKCTASSP